MHLRWSIRYKSVDKLSEKGKENQDTEGNRSDTYRKRDNRGRHDMASALLIRDGWKYNMEVTRTT